VPRLAVGIWQPGSTGTLCSHTAVQVPAGSTANTRCRVDGIAHRIYLFLLVIVRYFTYPFSYTQELVSSIYSSVLESSPSDFRYSLCAKTEVSGSLTYFFTRY
jgi:hypothetical protein